MRGRLALLCCLSAMAVGCSEDSGKPTPQPSASAAGGLSPEQASQVLAVVGDRKITLGDFAATLESMDQFERLRYQSKERRRKLLDEMIRVELLAQEAQRRGLDKSPEAQERARIILRDEVLKDLRSKMPSPAELSDVEVRKYFDAHKSDFQDPERRRVAVIAVADAAKAKKLLPSARSGSARAWGKLVQEHSLIEHPAPSPTSPLELAGDLGIVSAPGAKRGVNKRVPEAVRVAVFKIEKQGQVLDEVIAEGGRFYLVRLLGKTPARSRTYAEAERTIRVSIVQARIRAAEAKLEAELRTKYPVSIDEQALLGVKLPGPDAGVPAAATGSSSAAVAPSTPPPAPSAPSGGR